MNGKYRYLSISVPEVSILIDTSLYRYFPSLNGLVRVARVRVESGAIFERSIRSLIPLLDEAPPSLFNSE